jgi:hypothetical protein
VLVDGHTEDREADGAQQVHRRRVARFLHGDDVARLQHHSGDEVEPVQCA